MRITGGTVEREDYGTRRRKVGRGGEERRGYRKGEQRKGRILRQV